MFVNHNIDQIMTISVLLSASDAQANLARELTDLGARIIQRPRLNINPPIDFSAIDDAIENLFGYDWLIVKSPAAAEYFLRRFQSAHEVHELDDLKTLAIGERTQHALSRAQIHVDALAERSGEVFAALKSYAGDVAGLNLLLPSANMHRESFATQLEEAGARLDAVTTYRTCSSLDELSKLKALIAGGAIDCVAFTRPAEIDEFAALFDTDDLGAVFTNLPVACLDEATSNAANSYGLSKLRGPDEPLFPVFARLVAASID